MADLKLGFEDNKWLLGLYHQAVDKIGVDKLKAYDRSYPTIDYQKTAPGPQTPGADSVLQSYELIQAFVEEPALNGILQKPWDPSDNKLNRKIFAQFDEMVKTWRKKNSGMDPLGEEMARVIFQWVTRPKKQNGLGMAKYFSHPESSFDEAVATTYADCNEIYYILEVFYGRAGYLVKPEFVRVDQDGNVVLHVTAKVQIGQKDYLVDPLYHSFDAQHREHTPMSHQQLLAFSFINRAAVEMGKNRFMNGSEEYLKKAEAVDPYNPFVYLSRAWSFAGTKPPQLDESKKELQKADQVAPQFGETYGHWGFFYNRQDNFKQAIQFYKKSLKAEPRERKTRIQYVQVLACDGQEAEASQELKKLYDSYGDQWSQEEQQEYQRLEHWLSNQIKTKSCGKIPGNSSQLGLR